MVCSPRASYAAGCVVYLWGGGPIHHGPTPSPPRNFGARVPLYDGTWHESDPYMGLFLWHRGGFVVARPVVSDPRCETLRVRFTKGEMRRIEELARPGRVSDWVRERLLSSAGVLAAASPPSRGSPAVDVVASGARCPHGKNSGSFCYVCRRKVF